MLKKKLVFYRESDPVFEGLLEDFDELLKMLNQCSNQISRKRKLEATFETVSISFSDRHAVFLSTLLKGKKKSI